MEFRNIESDQRIEDEVEGGQFKYFLFNNQTTDQIIQITVTPISEESDPDLYVA